MIKSQKQKAKISNNDIDNIIGQELKYKSSKSLRYYDYLTILAFFIIFNVVAFLLNKYAIKSKRNYWEIFNTLAFALCSIVSITTGWLINRNSAKFYNSSIKRYDSTLEEDEGFKRRINKMFWLLTLLFLISSLIFLIISLI